MNKTYEVSENDGSFGLKLLKELDEGNAAISPFSIRTVFSALVEGAVGDVEQEILRFAQLPDGTATRRAGTQELIRAINASSNDYSLTVANGLWNERTYKLEPDYKKTLATYYQAEADTADFKNDFNGERSRINDWISKRTEDKIPELFSEGTITDETILTLANALYFKGFWEDKFDETLTQEQDFTLEDGTTVQVDMMRKGVIEKGGFPEFPYVEFDGIQAVLLPYKGGALGKAVLLPPKGTSVGDLEEKLRTHPEEFTNILTDLRPFNNREFSRVELPKHEIRAKYNLLKPMQNLGVNKLLVPSYELSGIGEGRLSVNAAITETYFKTDETGSEGAAATGVGVIGATSVMPVYPPVEFVADRPFLELILYRPSNSILFLNRITDPRG